MNFVGDTIYLTGKSSIISYNMTTKVAIKTIDAAMSLLLFHII